MRSNVAAPDSWEKSILTELPTFTEAGAAKSGEIGAGAGSRWETFFAFTELAQLLNDQCKMFNAKCKMIGRTTHFVVFALLAACAFAGCGGDSATSGSNGADASDAGASNPRSRPPQIDQKHPVVRLETNQGAITIRLDAVLAPVTVRNFLNYASDGFYDDTLVHYVDPGKMILAGGYSADRQPKPPRLPIRNEAHNGLKNTRGSIAMTRDPGQIDSATSQFFINLTDAPQRDHQGDTPEAYGYCVFGEVIEGLDIAEKISQSSTSNLGGDLMQTPEPTVVIKSVRVVR
jgi:cyclophilin family peptidyl-prolyl cis-trans isomerase